MVARLVLAGMLDDDEPSFDERAFLRDLASCTLRRYPDRGMTADEFWDYVRSRIRPDAPTSSEPMAGAAGPGSPGDAKASTSAAASHAASATGSASGCGGATAASTDSESNMKAS